MVHVGEPLVGGGADVDLLARDAERGHQPPRLILARRPRRAARRGIADAVGARAAAPAHDHTRGAQRTAALQPATPAPADDCGRPRRQPPGPPPPPEAYTPS